jgi:HK97 gp10 family phage protein
MATIKGLIEARAAFQRLSEVFRERLADASATTASEIARGARARLLSSPSIRTRSLYNAVTFTSSRRTGWAKAGIAPGSTSIGGVRVKGLVTTGKGGSASHAAGASIDIPSKRAHFVEFGTRHMPAEPFMIPSAEAQKLPYLDRCSRAGKLAEQDLSIGRNL